MDVPDEDLYQGGYMKMKKLSLLLLLLPAVQVTLPEACYWQKTDWQIAKPFPEDFLWGAGISHYQYEGPRDSHKATDYNNFDFLSNQAIFSEKNNEYHPSITHVRGDACRGWEYALDDVDLVYDIGLDVYRMSVSWEKINPKPGKFDYTALGHYKAVLDKCNRLGIKVLLGLHHYADPMWFTKLGGWTKRENIRYFVSFAREVYQALGDRVWLWATFNSPSGYAAKCFMNGEMVAAIDSKGNPVIQSKNLSGHSDMLCNICLAHVDVYYALKEEYTLKSVLPQHKENIYQKDPQIGILKNILQMEAVQPWDTIGCKIKNDLLDNAMFTFFTKGTYPANWSNSNLAVDERAPTALDFVGLNYYSHLEMNNFKAKNFPDEVKTQNPNYTIYPEGLYYALETIHKELIVPISSIRNKEIPLYVTENGIATDSDEHRELFFTRYLYALSKAIHNGINVKGYITWSLMDNYEWGSYNKKYGLYAVDFGSPIGSGSFKRTLKSDAGTQFFLDLVQHKHPAYTA